jgi:uncharacterized protein YecA (UPF0149 family)
MNSSERLSAGLKALPDKLAQWLLLTNVKDVDAATLACVTVWEIAELRTFLIKLSGRQMRHKQAFSNPALLAGLWVFLAMSKIMDTYSQEKLAALKSTARHYLEMLCRYLCL